MRNRMRCWSPAAPEAKWCRPVCTKNRIHRCTSSNFRTAKSSAAWKKNSSQPEERAMQPAMADATQMHPNQVDRKRIERALEQRERYRYVTPQVVPDEEEHGYRIESPCCSRNVEPAGGIIDIALLKYLKPHWLLYRKDHDYSTWVLHSVVETLNAALEILLPDEERVFWP